MKKYYVSYVKYDGSLAGAPYYDFNYKIIESKTIKDVIELFCKKSRIILQIYEIKENK